MVSPLPTESWNKIFEYVNVGELWALRNTCHLFREIVDGIFTQLYLREFEIVFDFGDGYLDEIEMMGKSWFDARLQFDHFADDAEEVAIFIVHDECEMDKTWEEMDQTWEKMRAGYSRKALVGYPKPQPEVKNDKAIGEPACTPWLIRFRGRYLDSELPGHCIDHDKSEMQFRWKDALTAFFCEQEYMRKKSTKTVSAMSSCRAPLLTISS
jgi:hypothetical protein